MEKDGKGRVAAREVMIMTPAISNLIREGKTHMIYSAIETGARAVVVHLEPQPKWILVLDMHIQNARPGRHVGL